MAPGLTWNVAHENYLLVAPPEGIATALARFQEWAESGDAGFREVWHVQGQSDRDLADALLGKGYRLRKGLSPTADLLERVWGDAQERGILLFWEVKAGNYLRRFRGDQAQAWRMALECHREQITRGRFKMSPLDQGPSRRLWQTMCEFICLEGLVHCCNGYQVVAMPPVLYPILHLQEDTFSTRRMEVLNADPDWVSALDLPRYEYLHWGYNHPQRGAVDGQVLSAIAGELARVG